MIFEPLKFEGAYLIKPEQFQDARGLFARTWCRQSFRQHGLECELVQCSTSYNEVRGTLRGMHLQIAPDEETKLVRCTRGEIFDVILDLRPSSETYLQWDGFQLTAENRWSLYVPKGFAHGFQTLTDGAEVFYQMTTEFAPQSGRGYRFDDPAFGIQWPLPVTRISQRDQEWPEYQIAADQPRVS